MKTCFSEGKLMKQFGNPLFLRGPAFQLTPLFLSNFFMIPHFVQISKTRPPHPNFMGRGNYNRVVSIKKQGVSHSQKFRGKRSFPNLVNSKTS